MAGLPHESHAIVGDSMSLRPPQAGVATSIDGRASLSRGNVEFLNASAGASIQRLTLLPDPAGVHTALGARARATYAESSGNAFINSMFVAASYSQMFGPSFGLFVYGQYEFDEFKLLSARATAGAGIVWQLLSTTSWLLQGSASPMYEHERLSRAAAPADRNTGRLATNATLRYFCGTNWGIQNAVYYQPRFDDPSDYRLLNAAELAVAMSPHVSLGVLVEYRFDSEPPDGVKRVDLTLSNHLRLSF